MIDRHGFCQIEQLSEYPPVCLVRSEFERFVILEMHHAKLVSAYFKVSSASILVLTTPRLTKDVSRTEFVGSGHGLLIESRLFGTSHHPLPGLSSVCIAILLLHIVQIPKLAA